MKWELLLPGCTTNSSMNHSPAPSPFPPFSSCSLRRTADALFHQAGAKGVAKSTCNLATFHCIAACLPHASCRLLANFLQRNFGDASVPPADTATCRAPSSPASAPAPLSLPAACHSHFGLDFARIFQLHYFSWQWKWFYGGRGKG